jgi:hypothetical protein
MGLRAEPRLRRAQGLLREIQNGHIPIAARYKRIDKPGTFHTQWSGDRTEISAEDTH